MLRPYQGKEEELRKLKISTKGKYGLIAMIDLALNREQGHIPLNIIAERQGISANYLEHLFSSLKKSGLVKSVKGAQGGYELSDHPSKITVGTVLRVLEGEIMVIEQALESNVIEAALNTHVWDKINAAISQVIDSITLEDMVQYYVSHKDSFMFYI